jgi:predicted DNA-binding transcriptional regulator AlpA
MNAPTCTIVTREELAVFRRLERPFIDRWIAAGEGSIPQMPHLPDLGRGVRFHLPSVDEWLLSNFQVGGKKEGAK